MSMQTRKIAVTAAIALALTSLISGCATAPKPGTWAQTKSVIPPTFPREFRGVWVASVANIDWPSKPDLPVDQQQSEIKTILDKCQELKLNAVILQVRPSADALYDSKFEPWSAYLTGQNGKAPDPYYDPLKQWCEEAHARGMELHAWINPFRAKAGAEKTPSDASHISNTHPEWVTKYGEFLWLDPGEEQAQAHSLKVLRDIVSRYDIDGLHVDDYFYPYPEAVNPKDKNDKREVPFPDDPSWSRYVQSGGKLSKDDWRRSNIDHFMQKMYAQTKKEKRWVKVGISPFGIWRPGNPEQIKGFDAYSKIYCDSKKWLNLGWCDYITPQLYWPIEQKPQSYPVLLDWWMSQNTRQRHVWPGLFTSRVIERAKKPDPTTRPKGWQPDEIVKQIEITRMRGDRDPGEVHFSMKAFLLAKDLDDALENGVYSADALPPETPWLESGSPSAPKVRVLDNPVDASLAVSWFGSTTKGVRSWAVYARHGNHWVFHVVAPGETALTVRTDPVLGPPDAVAVSAIGRTGNESKRVVWKKN
jgi:uncharacterized lipoprotein YddW (UPF0748 family)